MKDMRKTILYITMLVAAAHYAATAFACETRNLEFSGNLNASSAVTPPPGADANWEAVENAAEFSMSVEVFDALSVKHDARLLFFHSRELSWSINLYLDGSEVESGRAGEPWLAGSLFVVFEEDGTLSYPELRYLDVELNWANGARIGRIRMRFGAMLQHGSQSMVTITLDDGSNSACPRHGKVDYDGDGNDDFSIWRPDSGMWAILKSSTETPDLIWKQWGLPGDYPMSGDYTGDGKSDLVVWRPTNGVWYVCKSDVNFDCTDPIIEQFGLPGDRPIAIDFDRNGVADFAVWRPSTGTFYYKNPGNSGVDSRQWGLPGDIPIGTGVGQ